MGNDKLPFFRFNFFQLPIADELPAVFDMPALIPSGVDFCFSEFQPDFLSKFGGLKRHVMEFPSEYQDDEDNEKSVLDTFLDCGIFPTYSFPKDVVGFYVENGKGSEIVQKPERSLDTAISEYAPGRLVVINKTTYKSGGIYSFHSKFRPDEQEHPARPFFNSPEYFKPLYYCSNRACNWMGLEYSQRCPFCGEKTIERQNLLKPWGFASINGTNSKESEAEAEMTYAEDPCYREVLGAAEGMKEDKASWVSFFQWLRGRGLEGVKLIVGDKCLGMLEAVGEVFPEAKYQRCVVHFYRNVFSVVPKSKVKNVAKMLKAIHAQESKKASREKAAAVVAELKALKLPEAAKKIEAGIEETLTYCDFPSEHWTKIRTNNVIERMNREIRRRTRVVGAFPDGNSALMLVCARLRHVAGTQWGSKKYMSMKHLEAMEQELLVG